MTTEANDDAVSADDLEIVGRNLAPLGTVRRDYLNAIIAAAEQRGREAAWADAQWRYIGDYRDLEAQLAAAQERQRVLLLYATCLDTCGAPLDHERCDCGLQAALDATRDGGAL